MCPTILKPVLFFDPNRTKKLVFRAKLTMHTAFERPDNVDPAGVTSLAISKDHKNVYVGDDKGRVFMWSVSSKPGKGNTIFFTIFLVAVFLAFRPPWIGVLLVFYFLLLFASTIYSPNYIISAYDHL